MTSDSTSEKFHSFVNRWIVPSASVLGVLAIIFAGFRYMVRSEISGIASDVQVLKSDVQVTKTNVDGIHGDIGKANERIDGLLKSALERAFPASDASKNKIRGSLDDMKTILQLAKDQNIRLNPQLLITYGRQISDISTDPEAADKAWNMLGNLLGYRSYLNTEESPTAHETFSTPNGTELTAHIHIRVHGPGAATFTWPNRLVPENQSFILEPLESSVTLPREGHPFLRVTSVGSATLVLDGMRLKNVIFDGITIEYHGGPIAMENTYFVNCKFDVKPKNGKSNPPLQQFAKAVLNMVPASMLAS